MRKTICAVAILLATFGCFSVASVQAADGEEGFVSLFNGENLDGWAKHGGRATYKVQDGCIVGECVPNTPNNTFLVYEKPFGNFIFKCDFKCEVAGNSGVQFRSAIRISPARLAYLVFLSL